MVLFFIAQNVSGQTRNTKPSCHTSGIKNPIPKATLKVKEAWHKTTPVIKKGWEKTKKVTKDGIQTIKEKVDKYKLKQKIKEIHPIRLSVQGLILFLVY